MADTYVQHLTRGGELLRADRVDEARTELEAARGLKPGDAKILSLLGLVYFRLGQFDEARTIYADLVRKQPKDASLRLNLGLVHLKLGDVEAALGELLAAREQDPSQTRTVGYLGLAYARSGQYAKAREAFLQAGQDDLAREMEQYLAGGTGDEDKQAVGPPPVPADARGREGEGDGDASAVPSAVVDHKPLAPEAYDTPVGGVEARAGKNGQAETQPLDDEHEAPTARLSPLASAQVVDQMDQLDTPARGVVARDVEGIVTAAVRIATPRAPMATFDPEGRGTPMPLSHFATSRLIRPDDGELPFEVAAGDTLIVRVRGRVLSRTEGVIVSGGELSYEPATRRVRGAMTEEPFGSDARPMFFVSGQGHLCASPRGGKFTAVELTDDALYLREELVFAFEERLRWENGHIPGSANKMHVVQFRGEGCVALHTSRPPLTIKLAPEKVLYVDATLLAGWIGRVVPRVVAPAAGGDSSAPFVECSGEGIVIALEPRLADADAGAEASAPREG